LLLVGRLALEDAVAGTGKVEIMVVDGEGDVVPGTGVPGAAGGVKVSAGGEGEDDTGADGVTMATSGDWLATVTGDDGGFSVKPTLFEFSSICGVCGLFLAPPSSLSEL